MTEAVSLTGTWYGTYSYPDDWGQPPCLFTARLVQTGVGFFGSITETVEAELALQPNIGAYVEGNLHGVRVSFVKTYDGSGGWGHSVMYDGELSHDHTEITGAWSLFESGQRFSSSFIMVRRTRGAEAEHREAVATSV
ncbi:hypothetical protein PQU92_02755 [Asticcacaulis sp. BYS171W]|uniref:Lipocalin-like domain-containing protein n=1 Tax=Asticcacaulis aquaticus TaxID=2984212 RepID=A0ABT5HQF4_9CAUL|nr:hypothetical protein [Asticcacaulis aquaticus]MDC7682178.1 hypothetical protein [Asticcacaulis aquaticus]